MRRQGVRSAAHPARGHGSRLEGTGSAVTKALIGMNVGIYLASLPCGAIKGTGNWIFSHGALIVNGIIVNGNLIPGPADAVTGYSLVGVANGDWWRLITQRVPAREPAPHASTCTSSGSSAPRSRRRSGGGASSPSTWSPGSRARPERSS